MNTKTLKGKVGNILIHCLVTFMIAASLMLTMASVSVSALADEVPEPTAQREEPIPAEEIPIGEAPAADAPAGEAIPAGEGEAAGEDVPTGEEAPAGDVSDGEEPREEAPAAEAAAGEENSAGTASAEMPVTSSSLVSDGDAAQTGAAAAGTTAKSAIETLVSNALANLSEYTGTLTVTLEDGVYDGDVTLTKDAAVLDRYKSDFVLEIVAKDAGAGGTESAGGVITTGNFNVAFLNVIFKGLVIDPSKVLTVTGGTVDWYGTANADTVRLSLGDSGNANLYTGAGDDAVTLTDESGAGKALIDTGTGADTVTLTAGYAGVEVCTGDGADTVTAGLSTSKDVSVSAGDGGDTLTVDKYMGTANVTVDAGAGDDLVVVCHTTPTVTRLVEEPTTGTGTLVETAVVTPAGKLNILGGTGSDRVELELSLADTFEEVLLNGGDGSDRLYLTGTLDSSAANPVETSGNYTLFHTDAADGRALRLDLYGMEKLTDDLKNKRTVALTAVNGKVSLSGALADFTDYILTVPSAGVSAATLISTRKTLFSNLRIDSDLTAEENGVLTVCDVTAENINVLLRGRVVNVLGTVSGDNVIVVGTDGSGASKTNVTFSEGVGEFVKSLGGAVAELVSETADTEINIAEEAAIYALHDIDLMANVNHGGKVLFGVVISAATADAVITVDGSLFAGYDRRGVKQYDDGDVLIRASIRTSTGYNGLLKRTSSPMALSIVVNEAGITVGENACITATHNVRIASGSNIRANGTVDSLSSAAVASILFPYLTSSTVGSTGSDTVVGVAAAVILNNAYTDIYGRIAADGDVFITASGQITDTAAVRPNGTVNSNAGYVAVSVVEQNVRAAVKENAAVTAKGNVTVLGTAASDIETTVAPSVKTRTEDKVGSDFALTVGKAPAFVLSLVKSVVSKIPIVKAKQLQAALEKISAGDYTVRTTDESNDIAKGTVSITTETNDIGVTSARISVTPESGWAVSSVSVRCMKPGAENFTYEDAAQNPVDGYYYAVLSADDAVVFVDYTASEAAGGDDLFTDRDDDDRIDIGSLLDDAAEGGQSVEEELSSSVGEELALSYKKCLNGAVLTEREDSRGVRLSKTHVGEVLTFIANPAEGYKLTEKSLKVAYYIRGTSGNEVKMAEVVTADDSGSYTFTVPENILTARGLTVEASFEAGTDSHKTAAKASTQVNGSVAVTVANNDGTAILEEGATLEAEGNVTVGAVSVCRVTTTADGSSVTKTSGSSTQKTKPAQKTKKTSEYIPALSYMLRIRESENGTAAGMATDNANTRWLLTPAADEGYALDTIRIRYTDKISGTARTLTLGATDWLEDNGNGTYTLKINTLSVKTATEVELFFDFKQTGAEEKHNTHAGSYLLRNAVSLVTTAPVYTENGSEKVGGRVSWSLEGTKLKITCIPVTEKGYTISEAGAVLPGTTVQMSDTGCLYLACKDVYGNEVKRCLTRSLGEQTWTLELADDTLLPGTLLSVYAVFEADLREVSTTAENAHGTVASNADYVKYGDTLTVTVTPEAGYTCGQIKVNYISAASLTTKEATYALTDGKASFTVSDIAPGKTLNILASFTEKNISVNAGSGVAVSEKKVSAGDTVTLTPDSENAAMGKKVIGGQYTYINSEGASKTETFEGDHFILPADAKDVAGMTLSVTADLVTKDVNINTDALYDFGEVTAAAFADVGETLYVTATPKAGYRVKTLCAKIYTDGYYEKLALDWVSGNVYSLVVPKVETTPEGLLEISFEAVFEEGSSGGAANGTRIGAGVAVTAADSGADTKILGTVKANHAAVLAVSKGGASTKSAAGYSDARYGVAGAISVQVASYAAKARIYPTAVVSGENSVSVNATQKTAYAVQALGSGGSGSALGVGAGMAFGVNAADTVAAVADGAAVDTGSGSASLRVGAVQNASDAVIASAGAAGGTSVTPAAAVDVFGSSARAYVGKLNTRKNGETAATLEAGTVTVSALDNVSHTVTSDASAAGKAAAVGGAFAVSVLADEAKAELHNSVTTQALSVTAKSISTLTSKATASAVGGAQGSKTASDSKGSADAQTDKLLSGGSRLAGRNGGSSLTGGRVAGLAKGRQQAQTAEGSVAGAASVAVNIQENTSYAAVADGVDVLCPEGDVAILSQNLTKAEITANSSAAKSNEGLGVGVAVNTVNLSNIAYLGNGTVKAKNLTVNAGIASVPKKITVKSTVPTRTSSTVLQELISEYMYDLCSELGIQTEGLDALITRLAAEFVSAALEGTELKKFLDTYASAGTAALKLDQLVQQLRAIPENVLKPLMDVKEKIVQTAHISAEDLEAVFEDVLRYGRDDLFSDAAALAKSIGTAALDKMVSNLLTQLTGVCNGGSFDSSALTDGIKDVAMSKVKGYGSAMFDVFMNRLTAAVPLADHTLRAELMEIWNRSLSENLTVLETSLSDSVKAVVDYEKIIDYFRTTDIAADLKTRLKAGLAASGTALTQAALDKLAEKTDTAAFVADMVGRHVVSAVAVSGAGAKSVAVAGSVAVTVFNSTTKALLAEGGAVTVTGLADIAAAEDRKVTALATAATSSDGSAEDNSAAGADAQADSASDAGTSIENDKGVTVDATVGGTVAFDPEERVRTRVLLTADDSHILPEEVSYDLTTADGETKTGTVRVMKSGELYYITTGSVNEYASTDKIAFHVTFAENLHTLVTAVTDEERVSVGSAVNVSVDGREPDTDELTTAVKGDTVRLKVTLPEGKKLAALTYSYTDENNILQTVDIDTVDSQGSGEIVCIFAMPDYDIDTITVTFAAMSGEELALAEEEKAANVHTDGLGRTVGVGASFAFVYGDADVAVEIGKRTVTAGTLITEASSAHTEKITAVAGTDPLASYKAGETKDIALDAAVSLNMLDTDILVSVADGAKLTTTDKSGEALTEEHTAGELFLCATEEAVTLNRASGFAAGSATAVGAAAAVNLAETEASVHAYTALKAAGKVNISAVTNNKNTTEALATAMGADVQRALNKLSGTVAAGAESANKLSNGTYFKDEVGKKKTANSRNDTASKINKRLNEKKQEEGEVSSNNLSLSENVLRSAGAETGDTAEATEESDDAAAAASDASGSGVETGKQGQTSVKVQVAAAVGVSVGSNKAVVTLKNVTASDGISIFAGNHGNFSALATGAAMSLADRASSVAAAVAVVVRRNDALVSTDGNLSSGGDITVRSELTGNVDGVFRGNMSAQAIAGSVSGQGSAASLAGAVATVVNRSRSVTELQNTAGKLISLKGAAITVEAADRTRIAMRAGAVSASKGSDVGMGASFAVLVSAGEVKAVLGENYYVTADSFTLNAEKKAIGDGDYVQSLDLSDLITNSSNLTDAQRSDAKTGILDFHKNSDGKSYTVNVRLSSADMVRAVSLLNFLSSQNYYIDAVSGSVMGGSTGVLNGAGSFSVVRLTDSICAEMGEGSTVETVGDVSLRAENAAHTRIISGAVSAGTSNAAGLTVSFLKDESAAAASLGDSAVVVGGGNFTQCASVSGQRFLITVAAAGTSAKTAAGGTVNVLVLADTATAEIGDNTELEIGGTADITAATAADTMLITVDANIAASADAVVAAGGNVSVIVDRSEARVTVGAGSSLESAGDMTVETNASDKLVAASASVSGSAGAAVAGNLGVLINRTTSLVDIGKRAALTSTGGDITVNADADSCTLNISLTAAASKQAAVGADVRVNISERTVHVYLGDDPMGGNAANITINAKKGSYTSAVTARDYTLIAALNAGAAVSGASVTGNLPVIVSKNTIENLIGAKTKIMALKASSVTADYDSTLYVLAGSLAVGGGSAAVGASVMTDVRENTVRVASGSTVTVTVGTASAAADFTTGAKARETAVYVAVGAAGASSAAVSGAVVTLVNENAVLTDLVNAAITANGSVRLYALDDAATNLCAGSLSGAGTVGIGTAVVTVSEKRRVEALTGSVTAAEAGTVDIRAEEKNDMFLLAVSTAGSGSAAVGVGSTVLVYGSTVNAALGGTVAAPGTDTGIAELTLLANSETNLKALALSVAGSGSVAVTPEAVVLYFTGNTAAAVADNSRIRADVVSVKALSAEAVDAYVLGAAGSGTVGVSGGAAVVIGRLTTAAQVGQSTVLEGRNTLEIVAEDAYTLFGVSGAVGVSGVAGVAVAAVVSVLHNTVTAIADTGAVLKDYRIITVHAESLRDVTGSTASAGGAGTAGVGVSVLVLAAGAPMSQDAADMLMYGNAADKKTKATFDPDALLKSHFAAVSAPCGDAVLADTKDLGDVVSGNGQYESTCEVGNGTGFDAASGADYDSLTAEYDENAPARGENAVLEDTADVAAARTLGSVSYTDTLKDTVTVLIRDNCSVSGTDVLVTAKQTTGADLVTGALAGSGMAAVGAGAAVAVLHSDVSAVADGNYSCRSLTVEAVSGGEQPEKTGFDEFIADVTGTSGGGIRAVSVTGSASAVGVSVSTAVLRLDNTTRALLKGTAQGWIYSDSALVVRAIHTYDDALAATLTASAGGIVSVGASVAVASSEGTVCAQMTDTASVTGFHAMEILSNVTNRLGSYASTIGAGSTAVNAGVAAALSAVTVRTLVADNVLNGYSVPFRGTNAVLVLKSVLEERANARILGVSVGGVAVNTAAAVARTGSDAETKLGTEPGAVLGDGGAGHEILCLEVSVGNEVTSAADVRVYSVAVGGIGASGTVLLAFNDTKATAAANIANAYIVSLAVESTTNASAAAELENLSAGLFAGGVNVCYADLTAQNIAALNVTGRLTASSGLTVTTGEAGETVFTAEARGLTGALGVAAVSVIPAIARNRAVNTASAAGSGSADYAKITAQSDAAAHASIEGVYAGDATVGVGFAQASLEAVQTAYLTLSGFLAEVKSLLNADKAEGEIVSAEILVYGGSLLGGSADVARAYNRSRSVITVKSAGASDTPTLVNTAHTDAAAAVTGIGFSAAHVGVEMAFAYDQAVIETLTNRPGKASTNYTATATAAVDPSLGGVTAGVVNIGGNTAVAKSTAKATTGMDAEGEAVSGGSFSVETVGDTHVTAKINTPKVSVTAGNVAANIAIADLCTEQYAYVRNMTLSGGRSWEVLSTVSRADAEAILGGNGGAGVAVNLVGIAVNYARALSDVTAKAWTEGVSVSASEYASNPDYTVRTAAAPKAAAHMDTADVSVGVVSVGVNVLRAEAKGCFEANVRNAGTLEGVNGFTVRVDYTADADAAGGVSGYGIRGADVTVNEADAVADTTAAVTVTDVTLTEPKAADIGINGSHVTANAYIDTVSLSVSGISVGANEANAEVTASQIVTVDGLTVVNGTDVTAFTIENSFNSGVSEASAQAKVGSAGGTGITLLNGSGNTAYARVSPIVTTTVTGLSGEMPNAELTVTANGNVLSSAASYNTKGVMLVNASVLTIRSSADGAFAASLGTAAGKTLHVRSLLLISVIRAASDGTVDGTGTLWSGVNVGVNSVDSSTTTQAAVELGGSGSLVAEEDAAVGVRYEELSAKAIARTAKTTVTGAKVAVNRANANVSADNAVNYTAVKNAENVLKARKVSFRLEAKGITSLAEVGSTGGTSVSALDVTVHKADARSSTVNAVNLNGSCPVEAKGFVAENCFTGMSNTKATAANGTTEVSLGTFGNLEANSHTNNTLLISADGLTVTAEDIAVKADNKGVLSAATTTNPGGVSVIDGGSAKASAFLGTETDPETVSVRLMNAALNAAETLNILANSNVEAVACFEAVKDKYSLGSIKQTSIPTVSVHKTEIVLDGSRLTANKLTVGTVVNGRTQSEVDAHAFGLVFNADTMQGTNRQTQTGLIRLNNAVVKAKETLSVTMENNSDMQAVSNYEGASLFAACNCITASNELVRKTVMEIENSLLTAETGLTILARSGNGDNLYTYVCGSSDALGYADGKTEAVLTRTNTTGISVDNSQIVTTSGDLSVQALSDGASVKTEAYAHAGAIAVKPKAKTVITDTADTYVTVNGSEETTQLIDRGSGTLTVRAVTAVQNNTALADTEASGIGAALYSDAYLNLNLTYRIRLMGKVRLNAANALDLYTGMEPNTLYNLRVNADLSAVGGELNDNIHIDGNVRSHIWKWSNVTATADEFTHKAWEDARTVTSRDFVRGAMVPIAKGSVSDSHTASSECDFCQTEENAVTNSPLLFGMVFDRQPEENGETDELEEQEQVLKTVTNRLRTFLLITERISEQLTEAILDAESKDVLIRSWFSMQIERGELLPSVLELYDVDTLRLLEEDEISSAADLEKRYVRSVNGFRCYMLTNGSVLYTDEEGKLCFVEDTVSRQREDGTLDIFTVLNLLDKDTRNARRMYLNEEVTLDLDTNEINIPANNYFALYGDEVSGAWMRSLLEDIRIVYADPSRIATDDYDTIVSDYEVYGGISFWKEENGTEYYWIGLTPEQADENSPWLYYLALNTEEDSFTVWRTDAETLDGEGIVPVSLYIFRSMEEDAEGKVVYNCLAYDVPEGAESTLYLSTEAPAGEPAIPADMTVILRTCTMEGVEVPVSCVNDEYFLVRDLTEPTVEALDFYSASLEGEHFVSSVLSVDGSYLDSMTVTVKSGQYVWTDAEPEDAGA